MLEIHIKKVKATSNVDHVRIVQRTMAGMWKKFRQAFSEDLESLNNQSQRMEHISYPRMNGLFVFHPPLTGDWRETPAV